MAQRQIIIRRTRASDTRIQNRIIWDNDISQMARFCLIAMLSLPDSWDYSVRGMASMLKISKDTMGKYIKELEDAGYLKRKQTKCEAGRFSNTQYILTDTPGDFGGEEPCHNFSGTDGEEAAPCPNLPAPELPAPEKSPQKKRSPEQWKRPEQQNNPPSPPSGARRKNQFALEEEAKPVIQDYCGQDQELAQALADLIDVRVKRKAVNSKRAIIALLKELDRLSEGRREDKLLLIRQSVLNSWKSVFPLKNPAERRSGSERIGAPEGQNAGKRFSGVTYL